MQQKSRHRVLLVGFNIALVAILIFIFPFNVCGAIHDGRGIHTEDMLFFGLLILLSTPWMLYWTLFSTISIPVSQWLLGRSAVAAFTVTTIPILGELAIIIVTIHPIHQPVWLCFFNI
jgi:hypothetical protein